MNLKEKAEIFAIKAHDGQVRKADPEKPYIIHPIDVANKLKKYGFGKEVVAAGYLHDVVEDTDFSITDIKTLFGEQVASLVRGASETSKVEKKHQKELSWEDRKQETIDRIRTLDLAHKAIACTDKISNLEDISILFGKAGKVDFSSFKRGFEAQKWYYDNVYQSLIDGCDKNLPMFRDLRNLIDLIFYNDKAFTQDYINILSYQKQELLKLKSIFQTKNPSLEKIYFQNSNPETYNIIKKYFESIDIWTLNIPCNYSILGEYPKISYYINNDSARIVIIAEFYYKILEHTYSLPSSEKEEQAKIIVTGIINDLYQDSLNTVKRKIREKEAISLN